MFRTLAITLLAAGWATGASIYLDFGIHATTPSTYGAAAGTPGVWNAVPTSGPTSLVNTSGNSTLASVAVIADVLIGGSSCVPSAPLRDLLCDNFYSEQGRSWSAVITGLTPGSVFDLYLYSSDNPSLETGPVSINGVFAANSFGPGDAEALTEGVTYIKLSASPNIDGILAISGVSSPFGYAGLAGLQLVDSTSAVPEPATWTLLAAASLLALRRRR